MTKTSLISLDIFNIFNKILYTWKKSQNYYKLSYFYKSSYLNFKINFFFSHFCISHSLLSLVLLKIELSINSLLKICNHCHLAGRYKFLSVSPMRLQAGNRYIIFIRSLLVQPWCGPTSSFKKKLYKKI